MKAVLSTIIGVAVGVAISTSIKSCIAEDVASHTKAALPTVVQVQKEDEQFFQHTKYRQDLRSGLCFLTRTAHGITEVSCTDAVLKLIREREVE